MPSAAVAASAAARPCFAITPRVFARSHCRPACVRAASRSSREQTRAAACPGWRRTLVPTVLSVILLVFTASAIFSLATRRSDALLAAQLTADHSKCFKLFVAGDDPSMSAEEAEQLLSQQYGWDIHVPPSSAARRAAGRRAAVSLCRRLDSARDVSRRTGRTCRSSC